VVSARQNEEIDPTANRWASLTHDANLRGANPDHVQFARGRTAQVDDTTAAIGPAIVDAHEDGPTVANVCNEDLRAKWQCAMSSSKSFRTRYFAAGGATAAIEGRDPSFSVHRPGRQYQQRCSQ
jgi:hypothetical protein